MAKDLQTSAFVKKLAANDRPTRTKALQALQKFLSSPRDLPLLEFEKLWKGLYYSMWFCDRPRPQQRLALDLAGLFDIVPLQNFGKFQESWWVIIIKEWVGIDQWRLDKFLMLIRFVLNAIFARLAKEDWSQDLVEEFLTILKKHPLSGDKSVPTGIPFHLIDIYVDELEKVLFKEVEEEDEDNKEQIANKKKEIIDSTPVGQLITVFEELSREAPYKTLREKIRNEVLTDKRLGQWGVIEIVDKEKKDKKKTIKKTEQDEEQDDEEDDEEEESDDEWNGFE